MDCRNVYAALLDRSFIGIGLCIAKDNPSHFHLGVYFAEIDEFRYRSAQERFKERLRMLGESIVVIRRRIGGVPGGIVGPNLEPVMRRRGPGKDHIIGVYL